ncbi:lipopolysaccharide heptosyltransferase II [candidate division KSB1 bacterium]|nr:lipopolysaccharide heptosyltransferase II [candidate division KSB1 bacterium]MBL7092611.1 lipopolysaccharide heptosyltransferase II [candidate division KSB1 bacterium]
MRDDSSTKPPQKILLIRLSSIGDILLTTPVIRVLKLTFPNCTIDFVVKNQFAELLENHPSLNRLYKLEKGNNNQTLKKIKRQIKNNNYDLIVDLHKNFRSYCLTFRVGAKKIVRYTKFVFRRFLFVKLKINLFKQIIPIFERYFLALVPFNIQYDDSGLEIYFNKQTEKKIKTTYEHFINNQDDIFIGIAPGASFATKRWTIEGFQNVITYFIEQQNVKIILFGNKLDRELIESLHITKNQNILNSAGNLSISETGVLMDRCHVVLTNDSGLLHLASALKKPVVAIFGSTTEELGFFPSTTKNIVIQNSNLKCRPCSHVGRNKCLKDHFKCMKDITSNEVIKAVEKLVTVHKVSNTNSNG